MGKNIFQKQSPQSRFDLHTFRTAAESATTVLSRFAENSCYFMAIYTAFQCNIYNMMLAIELYSI